MKSSFFLRLCAVLLLLPATFVSCNKDQEDPTGYSFTDAELAALRTSTCLTADADEPYGFTEAPEGSVTDRATGVKNNFWAPGQTLRIRFLNGTSSIQAKVFNYFRQWQSYANINLVRVYSGEAEIRVAFDAEGHFSAVGKGNLKVPANSKTMNLEINAASSEESIRRASLHEFGHALGFMHEHQHPMANIPWNVNKVYEYYYKTQGWSKTEVDKNVLNKYTWESSQHTNYDSKSIMQYPVPAELTTNGFSVPWNTYLSTTDKDFIAKIYSDKRFRVRHAANTSSTITFWLNGIYHTLKPGESLWVPAQTSGNQLAIWECIGTNCGWDSYAPPYGYNYRIVTQSNNGNLTLAYD